MNHCIKTGAYVHLVDYDQYAPADLFEVGQTRVVRFNGDLEICGSYQPLNHVTHTLYLNRTTNYWRKNLGLAVVHHSDLVEQPLIHNIKENA